MRIRWRVTIVFLGLLLIALVLAVAIPLPKSAIERPCKIGQAVTQEDRQIDELGAAIQTEADAKAYIEALVKRWWDLNKTTPELEARLVRAEYAAVRNQKLIPESRVASTFKNLPWVQSRAYISVAELHLFRSSYVCVIYPKSVAQQADGTLAPGCRPTEALFLLHMLDANEGIPSYVRDRVREGQFPWDVLKWLKLWHPAAIPTFQSDLHSAPQNPDDAERIALYDAHRRKYFATHPDATFDHIVNDLFNQLGIDQN